MRRQTEMVDVDFIEAVDRRRDVRNSEVERLAASLGEIGLRTPISVRYFADRRGASGTEDSYVLVTGAHRLAAAKLLGWSEIECFVVDCDEIDAQLWEIAENLHRAELTTLERDEQIAEWVRLNAERISAQPAQKMDRGRPEGGVSAASRELGLNRDDARRAVKVASLSDEAKEAAREVGLDDNRTALLAAAKAEPAQQAAVIRDYSEKQKADRSRIDGDVKARAAREVASMLAEHVPGDWWDALKANLYSAGAANIANELANITGQSIMDRRYSA